MYAIPMSFSVVLLSILWNLILICKVQFARERPVTKLTFTPYILSFCFLACQLLETGLLEYTQMGWDQTQRRNFADFLFDNKADGKNALFH